MQRFEGPRVLGNVQANVLGLVHGLGFALFLEDGRLALLEGYSYGEETGGIDLADGMSGHYEIVADG